MSRRGPALRTLAETFVVAPPRGARVRARLFVSDADDGVLEALGAHLLASKDLSRRAAEGALGAKARAESRPGPQTRAHGQVELSLGGGDHQVQCGRLRRRQAQPRHRAKVAHGASREDQGPGVARPG